MNSPSTSWSTDPRVALNFALRPGYTRGAVIVAKVPISRTVASPNTKNVLLITTGEFVSESEVQALGTIKGQATIVPNASTPPRYQGP